MSYYPESETSEGEFDDYDLNEPSQDVVINQTAPPPISDICFLENAQIMTDQGIITIKMIEPRIHTINGRNIVCVTKTLSNDKFLVKFKKNSLGRNSPSQDLIMSNNHCVYHQRQIRRAASFIGKFELVSKIAYEGQILYNILLEQHGVILVNNMMCETLHPNNINAIKQKTRDS